MAKFNGMGGAIAVGYIREVGTGENKGLVRVAYDGNVTDWIEVGKQRAGRKRTQSTYTKGEQVLIAGPYGDVATQGVVVCSINTDQYPFPTDDAIDITTYDDGTVISYNNDTNTLEVLVAGAGIINIECQTANIKAAQQVTVDSPKTVVTGILEVLGQIIGRGGMAVSGGTSGSVATFSGQVAVTNGDVKVDGIGVKSHSHREQGDGNMVGKAEG